eukprot:TRINITY_DN2_c10_g1_i1.p1 TRINITY_DN2_c10_g1~~TRINITY_DN2_c10_g1_i1.p1  ORF type:complete len:120 (+),score=11.46 TRINITY_DN2_c10_g1_i1:100-459(+)
MYDRESWRLSAGTSNPSLIYNTWNGPRGKYPLAPESQEYSAAFSLIDEARVIHLGTVEEVPNEMARGDDYTRFNLCCDPNSPDIYPDYPKCTCNPENFEQFVRDKDGKIPDYLKYQMTS